MLLQQHHHQPQQQYHQQSGAPHGETAFALCDNTHVVRDRHRSETVQQAQPLDKGNKKTSWGVVFPVHGNDGPDGEMRNKISATSWLSLCRAMRNVPMDEFNVIFIDDRGKASFRPFHALTNNAPAGGPLSGTFDDQGFIRYVGRPGFEPGSAVAWEKDRRQACNAPNLIELRRVQGFHNIDQNMQRGFLWASKFDMIINADSDLFFIRDYFDRIHSDYEKKTHDCPYPIISGYTSALFGLAYGANYVFSRETYKTVVALPIQVRAPWDEALSEEHVRWCAEWPSRPATSYIQHYANKDGIHYSRDGHKEKGWNFPWDSYNIELVLKLDPTYPERAAPELNTRDLPRTYDTEQCFTEQKKGCIQGCARTSIHQAIDSCHARETLKEAKELCLKMPDCGGVLNKLDAPKVGREGAKLEPGSTGAYELRANNKLLGDPTQPKSNPRDCDPQEVTWQRTPTTKGNLLGLGGKSACGEQNVLSVAVAPQ